ncbi:hypothetical protein BH24CHL4_BH24CHL4_01700 [soil metagenome]
MALRPNVVLSRRYRLEKRVRSTGDADVHLAYDALLHRPVTVVIPQLERVQSPHQYQAFVHRHQVASALHHRNIVAILDIGEDHDRPYVVSEYFVGDSLANIIEDEAPFVIDDVAILIEQLARGLEHAYKRGVVHGDLTPDHVIIDASGLAKINDLGMIEGQFLLDSATRASLESNPYLPGGLQGNSVATHALDVHALAAIAYEMLVGHTPRVGESRALAGFTSNAGRYDHPSQQNGSIPERAGAVVQQGLLAHDHRAGLTAMQFSQALTSWRSMTAEAPPAKPPNATQYPGEPRPFLSASQSWPAPGDALMQTTGPDRAASSRPRMSSSNAVRWLFLSAVIISVAAIWTLAAGGSSQDAITASSLPDELLRLLQAAAE